jgi:ABC-type Fe3+/spermidine/putrescine transport system ATPase subunit
MDRIVRALKLIQLEGYESRWPHELSGGQLQRVAIARAVVIEPSVLLLDEPLSNLDAKLRIEMRGEIRRLQKTLGITVIYVTHDQDEALSMSDRIAVMRSGRVEQIGQPAAIYGTPATPFVAKFVGATNLLEGTVARRSGDLVDVTIEGGSLRVRGGAAQAGDRVEISLRPEAIRLLDPGEAAPPDWIPLNGTLNSVEYLGAVTRLYVRLSEGGPPLQLMVSAAPATSGEIRMAYHPASTVVWTTSR